MLKQLILYEFSGKGVGQGFIANDIIYANWRHHHRVGSPFHMGSQAIHGARNRGLISYSLLHTYIHGGGHITDYICIHTYKHRCTAVLVYQRMYMWYGRMYVCIQVRVCVQCRSKEFFRRELTRAYKMDTAV